MFLIDNPKYCNASLLNKQFEILFVLAQLEAIVVVRECANALCKLCGTCCCFVHNFSWEFESLLFCWGWDCSYFILKFEQNEPCVLISH